MIAMNCPCYLGYDSLFLVKIFRCLAFDFFHKVMKLF